MTEHRNGYDVSSPWYHTTFGGAVIGLALLVGVITGLSLFCRYVDVFGWCR